MIKYDNTLWIEVLGSYLAEPPLYLAPIKNISIVIKVNCGSDGKASVCNAGDPGSIPGLGRSPGEGNGSPLQYSCLENPMDHGACRLLSMGSQSQT